MSSVYKRPLVVSCWDVTVKAIGGSSLGKTVATPDPARSQTWVSPLAVLSAHRPMRTLPQDPYPDDLYYILMYM